MTDMFDFPQPDGLMPIHFIWHVGPTIVGAGHSRFQEYDAQAGPPGADHHAISTADAVALEANLRGWWFDGVAIVRRVPAPIHLNSQIIEANGLDEAVISDIPAGCLVSLQGPLLRVRGQPITAPTVTLTSTTPGQLRVWIACPPPFQDWEGVIDAV